MATPWLLRIIRSLRRDTAEPEFCEARREEIRDSALPSFEYYLLTLISTVTATYGLLADSTAVVIGAMLLAPLMGPIFGIALAVADGDEQLLWKSIRGEIYGVLVAIGIAFLIGLSPYRPEFGANIIARTTPTIYDLMIAFAAGLGGAMGLVNKRVSASLPGVAIAVALLPPLATVGLCLADGWWTGAGGALLLFFANFLAIAFMATLTFIAAGLARLRPSVVTSGNLSRSLVLTIVLLVLVGAFLTNTLLGIVNEQRTRHIVRDALTARLKSYPGTDLTNVVIDRENGDLRIAAVVLAVEPIEADTVAELEASLVQDLRRPLHLIVRSLVAQDRDKDGAVYLNPDLTAQSEAAAAESAQLQRITAVLQTHLKDKPGAELGQVTWQKGPPLTVRAIVRAPEAVEPGDVKAMQEALIAEQSQDVRLVIRSLLARDADAEHFVYDVQAELPTEAVQIRGALYESARVQLLLLDSRIELKELRYGGYGERVRVLLQVASPRIVSAAEVAQVEAGMRADVSAAIDLAIAVSVGAEVLPSGIDADPLTEFMQGVGPEASLLALPAPPAPAILPSADDVEAPEPSP